MGNALALSTYPQAGARFAAQQVHTWRREYPSGVTRRARRRPQLPSLVSVPCPHTVRSTHAGGLFHSFWFASMSVFIRGGHDNGTVLLVRGLPGSSIRLPPLRPWPNLLCRRPCTRSASALPARSRPALSGNLPRAHETCGAQQALSRPNENSDASGFTTAASE